MSRAHPPLDLRRLPRCCPRRDLLAVARVHGGTGWALAVVDAFRSVGLPMTVVFLEAAANVVMFLPFGVLGLLLVAGPRDEGRDLGPRSGWSRWRRAGLVVLRASRCRSRSSSRSS
ncbi:hypothetical protein NKG05_11225 [Oerskovia sp. M15]